MTVHDRLVSLESDDRETRAAEELLATVVPSGRPIVLTDEVLAAARAADAALLAMLLAPEVASAADDLGAIAEAAALDDGSRLPLEQVRAELQKLVTTENPPVISAGAAPRSRRTFWRHGPLANREMQLVTACAHRLASATPASSALLA